LTPLYGGGVVLLYQYGPMVFSAVAPRFSLPFLLSAYRIAPNQMMVLAHGHCDDTSFSFSEKDFLHDSQAFFLEGGELFHAGSALFRS
jgi:hypothetical protein